MVLKPCLQDKDTIFGLAKNPKYFGDIQKKLQTFDFNVNTECDNSGDFLLHIACKGGLVQLPLIMALVKIQGADVELCNAGGMTPLMLAAAAGNCVLCDVLMCLFGANPNKPNPNDGRCALHYAAEGNHRKTVECLIRRGADVNVEDHDGRRADDTPFGIWNQDDCKEVINFNRTKRLELFCDRVRKGDLEDTPLLPTDMCVVDDEGYTLIMIAAIYNKADTLYCLLDVNKDTINAQHSKTGMTALAMAAQMGNMEAAEVLLEKGAIPTIPDMEGYLPLHHSVLNNQETVVDVLLEFFPETYVGLYKAMRICKRNSIHVKLKSAWDRRQEEIVTPKLMDCAINGNGDDLYRLLDEGDNINPKSGSGNWPLYVAVESGHIDVVKLLFEKGGDIRKRHSTTGATVLHIAARMGHMQIVEFLVKHCYPKGRSIFPSAAEGRHRRMLDINAVDSDKRTALQIAAEKGFMKTVQLLLQCGASTAVLDQAGMLFTVPEYEGVRMMVDADRDHHTKEVMKCIQDKSKRAFKVLQQIWLARFDHNLRNKESNTPLMVACRVGWLPVIKFLLSSAVYQNEEEEEDSWDDSDADSGVLDPTGFTKNHTSLDLDIYKSDDPFQASGNFSQSTEYQLDGASDLRSRGTNSTRSDLSSAQTVLPNNNTLHALLLDVNRPKGQYIYHHNLVSHVCAVNLYDGSTALHHTIEAGDNHTIVKLLLQADSSCLNMQDDAGLSPLHLACRHGRKKVIDNLLAQEGLDLNMRTLEGLLPEEMTTSKSITKMVQKARFDQLGVSVPPTFSDISPSASKPPSTIGSTIDFEKIQGRYEAIKKAL